MKIKYKPNHKADLIKRHLMYLFDDKASTMLKILAVEFLYPYRNEDQILEKLEYFYKKEKDAYLKDLLKKAIEGKLENYLETDFEYSKDDKQETSQRHFRINNNNVLTSDQIALMKHFSK
jgi:uncharacterized protein YehS (DUF1456 family)